MTTPSSSSLSLALSPSHTVQRSQQELPRLQLAPPEHQKQPHQPRQQTFQVNPPQQESALHRPDEATSISSSREVSPVVAVEQSQGASSTSASDKRKNANPYNTQQKKRKTEGDARNLPVQYGLGNHYPYAYLYPPNVPPPPPPPALSSYLVPPPPSLSAPQQPSPDMSFNEFQWRLLNLCAEFYEAATELLRATPHSVLSQAFQLLNRGGNGTDPISVLNDARRTCDLLLTSPQTLAAPPPQPTSLSLPILNSLAHLNAKTSAPPPPASFPSVPTTPTTSYYTSLTAHQPVASAIPPPSAPPPRPASPEKASSAAKSKEKTSSNILGTWKESEIEKLKMLAEKYRMRGRPVSQEEEEERDVEDVEEVDEEGRVSVNGGVSASITMPGTTKKLNVGEIDWEKVVAEFGEERSRHQLLIKATLLGLKPSSSLPGKRKKKRFSTPPLPAPTFSSISAKSIPTGYASSLSSPLTTTPLAKPTTPTSSAPAGVPPTAVSMSPIGPPSHGSYPQSGWYPQTSYYPYPQPVYYSGPQGYSYAPPPQSAFYGQSYAPVSPSLSNADATGEKRGPGRPRKDTSSSSAPEAPIPPPSLPPKMSSSTQNISVQQAQSQVQEQDGTNTAITSTANPMSGTITNDAMDMESPDSTILTPAPTSLSGASSTGGTAGVLRRPAGNASLFTYTPLPHGPMSSNEVGN